MANIENINLNGSNNTIDINIKTHLFEYTEQGITSGANASFTPNNPLTNAKIIGIKSFYTGDGALIPYAINSNGNISIHNATDSFHAGNPVMEVYYI